MGAWWDWRAMTDPILVSDRTAALQHAFAEEFGSPAGTHLVRAPGRVNLMGDHTDYNGLPVMPMAIQRDMMLLARERSDGRVNMASADPRFTPRVFELSGELDRYAVGDWGNYAKAAGRALAERFGPLRGFDAVVSSSIPIAAGLSSSSALVMAVALAILDLADVAIGAPQLMQLVAEAERYVGTKGGGMDQAICLGAQPGTASRIDFNPLRLTPTSVPRHWRFVVAFSGVRAEKSGVTMDEYNSRTRECKQALNAAAAVVGASEISTYAGLMSGVPVDDLLAALEQELDGLLLKRLRHVVTEATRVTHAETAMKQGDIAEFGELMSQSHRSLRDDLAVSTVELDTLTDIAVNAGAVGARLTGAGFGGCVVALCSAEKVGQVMDALEHEYYRSADIDGMLVADCLFVAVPSGGASVIEL